MSPIGIIATKNNGVTIDMRTRVHVIWKKRFCVILSDSGIDLSTYSTSLLKRFIILPDGVESKNSIVLLRIDLSILSCNKRAPLKHQNRKDNWTTRNWIEKSKLRKENLKENIFYLINEKLNKILIFSFFILIFLLLLLQ